ncbi:MAG: hypothetical protein K2F69_03390 [Bacteroidaceae bacterium]|nr:hypothetical protein [Bacteroidaceae bacterium]
MNRRLSVCWGALDCYGWSTDNYVMIPAAVYGGTGDTFMMALEVPGIYVCRNRGEMLVFDHVEVKTLAHKGGGMVLQITTPTSFDATVTVLAEEEEQDWKPLGDNAFTEWKDKVKVKAGRMVTYKVK